MSTLYKCTSSRSKARVRSRSSNKINEMASHSGHLDSPSKSSCLKGVKPNVANPYRNMVDRIDLAEKASAGNFPPQASRKVSFSSTALLIATPEDPSVGAGASQSQVAVPETEPDEHRRLPKDAAAPPPKEEDEDEEEMDDDKQPNCTSLSEMQINRPSEFSASGSDNKRT